MAANNQGIVHYAPRPFPAPPYCGNRRAHMAVRTTEAFYLEPHRCARCEVKLGIREALEKRRAAPQIP
jgi:hypothetical protein